MAGYLSSRKLTNVRGRINYITNQKKQENIIDSYNTTENEFWKMLAKENQERHKEAKAGGICCEARELIMGIPQNLNVTAKQICDIFKNKYEVECSCAIHQNNKKGITNKHCHLIFSERKKLSDPKIVEEKRAARSYYYDEKGKKCSKEKAVKSVKKGEIIRKASIRFFSDKNDYFKTQKFIYECKQLFLKETLQIDWTFEEEKTNKELSEKHIGKNNPKEEFIKQNNKLKGIVKDVCKASDFIEKVETGTTFKKLKKEYNIENFSTKNFEKNEQKVYDFVEAQQEIYKYKVKDEVKEYNFINKDVNILSENSYIYEPVQNQIISDYEPEAKTRNKKTIIDFIKEKLNNMLKRIYKLEKIQNLLYIEPKNQLEIEKNKRTNHLTIKDEDYYRKQQMKEYDREL